MDALSLTIEATDVNKVRELYTHIRVWRSSTATGTYALVTADEAEPATMAGSVDAPYTFASDSLQIKIDDDLALTVALDGAYSLSQLIKEINDTFEAEYGYTIADELPTNTNRLRLRSPITGRESRLEIVSGVAAAALIGLTVTAVLGYQEHLLLRKNVFEYTFWESAGELSYWYRTDYYSVETGATSSVSDPRQGEPTSIVDPTSLSLCRVSMANIGGQPIPDVEIRFFMLPPFEDILVAGSPVTVFPTDPIHITTDGLGYAETSLIRGMNVRVVVRGSWVVRDFEVPDLDEFYLFDLVGTSPDGFDIAKPDYTWAKLRRTPGE